MIEASADVVVPVSVDEAFAALTKLDAADWLPAVRRLRHIGGPKAGVGGRYAVEVGLIGKHLEGVLVCREALAPQRLVLALEDGLDLTVTLSVSPVRGGGASVEINAKYSIGGGPFGGAMERASAGAARREVGRAAEGFAAQFGRKLPTPPLADKPARRRTSA